MSTQRRAAGELYIYIYIVYYIFIYRKQPTIAFDCGTGREDVEHEERKRRRSKK